MNGLASLRGAALLLIAATAWGGLFPVAMVTLPVLDPFHMTAIRYGITAIIFVGLLALAEGPPALKMEGRGLRAALLGTAGFAGLGLLVFVGLQYSRPEHGAIMMATQPLIAAGVAWLLRGVRPARATVAFLGVALVGVLLVVTKGRFTGLFVGGTGFGDLMMFLGAVSWVIYSLGAADFPSWSPLRYTALTCMLSLPAILGVMTIATATGYVSTPSARDVESVGWQLAYIIGIASVLAVLSWNAGNKLLGVTNGMLFINFVPVTVFAIRIAQGHHFQPIEFVGAALVIGALIANNAVVRRAATRAQQAPRRQFGFRYRCGPALPSWKVVDRVSAVRAEAHAGCNSWTYAPPDGSPRTQRFAKSSREDRVNQSGSVAGSPARGHDGLLIRRDGLSLGKEETSNIG